MRKWEPLNIVLVRDRHASPSALRRAPLAMKPFLLVAAFLLPTTSALADQICKYVDPEGRITYSTATPKDHRKVLCFDPMPERKPKPAPKPAARKPGADEAGFPRVDGTTQRRRDDDRRRILEQELTDEQKLLDQARRILGDTEGGTDRSQERDQPMRESINTHLKNIEAIRRELSNVK